MPLRISTKTHALADYATGATLLVAPGLLGARDARARALLRGVGASMLGQALVTDWELAAVRREPVRAHLAADAATGATLLASPWLLGLKDRGAGAWLPTMLVGALEAGAAALTDPRPADVRDGDAAPATRSASVPGAPTEHPDQRPGPLTTPSGDAPPADSVAGLRPYDAPAPSEAPGPSVSPVGGPASTTELEERIDRTVPDAEELGVAGRPPIDQLAAREEAAAAAEAAAIGGTPGAAGEAELDPAARPVYEAGGGEQEGFELAETELIENATHGDGRANPLTDAFAPEAESDRSTAEYGEPDQLPASEDAARERD